VFAAVVGAVMIAALPVISSGPADAAASFGPTTPVPLSNVTDIDNHGRMTGGDGVVYDPATGTVTPIGPLGGGSSANAITDGGLVAGTSGMTPSSSVNHAVVYDLTTGTLTDLGTVGFNAWATDVTDAGLAVGWGYGDPGVTHGFIADLDTGDKTILGAGSRALAVNDDGLVLGDDSNGSFVIDTHTDARIELSDRIPGIVYATKLSDTGLVAGEVAECVPIPSGCANGPWDIFVHDLAANHTWRMGAPELGEAPEITGLTDGGAVVGTAHSLDYRDGFVALPETAEIYRIPPNPGRTAAIGRALNDRGELAAIGCFWDDFIPAQFCDRTFRTTVELTPSPPRDVMTSSCTPPATISWQPPRFDGFLPLSGYDVRRNGVTIASLPPTAASFVDAGASSGAAYQVVARNALGGSPPSGVTAWPPPPCVTGIVRGVVTSAGVPQPGIDVRLVAASDGHLVRKTVTGSVGQYWFGSLAPGQYQVRFSERSWRVVLEWFDDQPTRSTATVIDTRSSPETVADADLAVAARIAGTVTDDTGVLAGIDVRVYDATTGALLAKAKTELDGTYAVEGLPARDVKVRFSDPKGFHQLRWCCGGTTFATADTIWLDAGETATLYQSLAGAGLLAGTILNTTGDPVVGLPVLAYDPATRHLVDYAFTDAGGRYRIPSLRPGAVLVRFGDALTFPVEWYDHASGASTADPVPIAVGLVTTVDVSYGPSPP
jgi:hypothetical protein